MKVKLTSKNSSLGTIWLMIVATLALFAGLIVGMGFLLSAVLSWFGLSLIWWKCSIIWIVIGFIGNAFRGKEN